MTRTPVGTNAEAISNLKPFVSQAIADLRAGKREGFSFLVIEVALVDFEDRQFSEGEQAELDRMLEPLRDFE